MQPPSSLARAHLSNLGVVPSKELGSGGPRPVSSSARVASEGPTKNCGIGGRSRSRIIRKAKGQWRGGVHKGSAPKASHLQ